MLEYAYKQNEHPVAIRVPNTQLISTGIEDNTDYLKLNKFKIETFGLKSSNYRCWKLLSLANEVKQELRLKFGIDATVINPRFVSGIDTEMLEDLKANHDIVITLEDGQLDGDLVKKLQDFTEIQMLKVLNFGGYKRIY